MQVSVATNTSAKRDRDRHRSSRFSLYAIFALIALKLFFSGLLTFPGFGIAIKIVDAIFVLFLFVFLSANSGYYFSRTPQLQISLCFLGACFFLTELLNTQNLIYAIYEVLKVVTPFFAFMALFKLSEEHEQLFIRLTRAFFLMCYALALSGLAFLEREMNRGESFLPAYFSGLHTSAYVLSICGIISVLLYRNRLIGRSMCFTTVAISCFFVLYGWNVKTAIVLMLVFFLVAYWQQIRLLALSSSFAGTLVLAFGALLYMQFSTSHGDLYRRVVNFSSGRTEMWLYKLELFANAKPTEWLVGKGLGSDFVISDVWWWAAKDSHNDFLHVLTEIGLLGLAALIATLLSQRSALPKKSTVIAALFVSYVAASAISNGLIFRPLPALLYSLALCVAALPARIQGRITS